MGDEQVVELAFPLDNGFFRRQCPFCRQQFKVLLDEDELDHLKERGVNLYMLEAGATDSSEEDSADDDTQFHCPYCGQAAASARWFTDEQMAYVMVVMKNIVARIVNEQFVRPLKRTFGNSRSGSVSSRFEGKEMQEQKPWISPETDDMTDLNLDCCQRRLKIAEEHTGTVYCFFCGFPHERVNPS